MNFDERRNNFGNETSSHFVMEDGCIKAAIGLYDPLTTFDGKRYGGTCVLIFEILMEALGFCWKYYPSPNGLWGTEYPNGSWDGLVGQAQRKEVEIIVCPVITTRSRYKVVDFAKTVMKSFYFIIYQRPKVKPNIAGFVMPFTYETWLAVFGTTLFITLLSYVLNTFFKIDTKMKNYEYSSRSLTNLQIDSYVKILVSQPVNRSPSFHGSRLLLAVWLLFALILGVVFKCNLKALLIVQRVEVPFNTLKELVNQNEYKWSFLKGSIIPQFFKPAYEEDPDSDMGKGWSRRGELYTSADQILPFILERKMACITLSYKVYPLLAEDFTKHGGCRLAVARERLLSLDMTFGLRKHSKLTALMDKLIMNMDEFGILQKMFREDSTNASYCIAPPGHLKDLTLRPLTIVDFMGVFTILAAGYSLAVLALCMEITCTFMKNKHY